MVMNNDLIKLLDKHQRNLQKKRTELFVLFFVSSIVLIVSVIIAAHQQWFACITCLGVCGLIVTYAIKLISNIDEILYKIRAICHIKKGGDL